MSKRKISKYYIPNFTLQVDRIDNMLGQVELEAIRSQFKKISEKTKKVYGTLYDYLEALLEHEVVYREGNRVDRWNQIAKFPFSKTLEDYDFSFPDSINQSLIMEVASCEFVREKKNVLFLGPTGVGKTHLAVAVGKNAIDKGFEVKYISLRQLIQEVNREIRLRESFDRLIQIYSRVPLLILDELEYEKVDKSITPEASDFLYQVLRNRYEVVPVSTIFTSNKTFKGWDKIFWSKERENKIIDRILEGAHMVIIEGDSYRTKDKLEMLKGIKNNSL